MLMRKPLIIANHTHPAQFFDLLCLQTGNQNISFLIFMVAKSPCRVMLFEARTWDYQQLCSRNTVPTFAVKVLRKVNQRNPRGTHLHPSTSSIYGTPAPHQFSLQYSHVTDTASVALEANFLYQKGVTQKQSVLNMLLILPRCICQSGQQPPSLSAACTVLVWTQ